MVRLLKLHAYEVFSLSEPMQKKLADLVIDSLSKKELSVGDLLSHASVTLTNGQTLKKEQAHSLTPVLIKAL
jgi:hypothetical protein